MSSVSFAEGDYVVYPTHGVGQVVSIENQEIGGMKLQLFVITFDRDRMTLRVPVAKATKSGLRKLSSRSVMDTALSTLKGRANCGEGLMDMLGSAGDPYKMVISNSAIYTLPLANKLPFDWRKLTPVSILAFRLKETPLPAPTRTAAPGEPGAPVGRPAVVPFQTCDGCDRPFRSAAPGRCRDCRNHRAEAPLRAAG